MYWCWHLPNDVWKSIYQNTSVVAFQSLCGRDKKQFGASIAKVSLKKKWLEHKLFFPLSLNAEIQTDLCFLWCSVDARNTQGSVRILLPWLCVVSWLWQVPAARASAGQDSWACCRGRSLPCTHLLCFVLAGAVSTARPSRRQMRRSTWTKVKGPGAWGFWFGLWNMAHVLVLRK